MTSTHDKPAGTQVIYFCVDETKGKYLPGLKIDRPTHLAPGSCIGCAYDAMASRAEAAERAQLIAEDKLARDPDWGTLKFYEHEYPLLEAQIKALEAELATNRKLMDEWQKILESTDPVPIVALRKLLSAYDEVVKERDELRAELKKKADK